MGLGRYRHLHRQRIQLCSNKKDFNDDVASLSLANNESQEPLLYNLL